MGIELRIVGTACWTARHLEHRIEVVRVRFSRLGLRPRAAPGELPVLRPDAIGERERPHAIARHRGVDPHQIARDLLLHDGI